MIEREANEELKILAKNFKAVAVIGPRQSGKTTLCRAIFPEKKYVSLENPDTRLYAREDPRGFLREFPEGGILDEIQQVPELFSYLQQILDESKSPGQFILTGSNNFLIQENITQSLAGRIGYLQLLPLTIDELNAEKLLPIDPNQCLLTGFYPAIADQKADPIRWYTNYLKTYVERDVRQIKNILNLTVFEKFLRLCAGRVGQLLNANNLAVELGVDNKTINSWLGVLETSFIIILLRPHHQNFNKRIVKMPKLYFTDTGLACSLLGIKNTLQLETHPLRGNLFENMIVADLWKNRLNKGKENELFFWRDNTGNELDLLWEKENQLIPVEIKSGKTINSEFFKGLKYWEKLSGIPNGYLIYGGESSQNRSSGATVLPWNEGANIFR